MKKFISVLLSFACLALASCGNTVTGTPNTMDETTPLDTQTTVITETPTIIEPSETDPMETTTVATEAPKPATIYSFGESVESDMLRFTPKFEGFHKEVGNWPDKNYLTPNGKSAGSNPFKASDEKIMMTFSGTFEFIGKSSRTENFEYTYSVIYANDYEFKSHEYGGSHDYTCGWGMAMDAASNDWNRNENNGSVGNGKMKFEALSAKKTRYVRFCIEVPEILATDESSPIQVIFNFDGNSYVFNIR